MFLLSIKQGKIPQELATDDNSTKVDLQVEDRYDEKFVAPENKFKAFSG